MEKVLTEPDLRTAAQDAVETLARIATWKGVLHNAQRAASDEHERLRAALAEADEARGLDVERLARAVARIAEVGPPAHLNPDDAEEHWRSYLTEATDYAAEYARLAAHNADDPETVT